MARTHGFDNPRERAIRSALHRMGYRFRIHYRGITGTTRSIDIAFPRRRLAIFCDGCFWHGCPLHATQPKSNGKWWLQKLTTNVSRDRDTDARLRSSGWSVLRIWEHESIASAVRVIEQRLEKLSHPEGSDHITDKIECIEPFRVAMPSIAAVDLFCGVGGLTHGLRKAGVGVLAGYDIDPACAWPYARNNGRAKFRHADVSQLAAAELRTHFDTRKDSVTLLAGCAPCQPFSSYSLHKADESDSRWPMLEHFGRLVAEVLPTLVTMENVPQVRKHKVFRDFVKTLRDNHYEVSVDVVRCEEYGIPQARTRLVLLASRLGAICLRGSDPRRDKRRTVRSAIEALEQLGAGEVSSRDPIHRTSRLTALNERRMKAARPGGSWRDWEPELLAECHKSETGQSFPGVYGRMEWDEPSPTITTQFYGFGSGRFGHPEQDRALSLREGAILQTFPHDYEFVEVGQKVHMTTVGRLIGNAVPVRLGQVIGESLKAHVDSVWQAVKDKKDSQT